jgi:hypothetical protein
MCMIKSFFTILFLSCMLHSPVCPAEWSPMVYNGIKWTAENQGQSTITYTTFEGITRVPIAYHGGVDTNGTGEITNRNIETFTRWGETELPSNYAGPVVLDYEQPWWKELAAKTIAPERLQEILSVYKEGVNIATRLFPNAQWGYWGLPMLRNTSNAWEAQGLSFDALTEKCSAMYPDIYDSNPNNQRLDQTKFHIEKVLAAAAGQIPVYVFASPRFTGQHSDHSQFVPDDVFLKQVNAALQAVWVDSNGMQHRVQGVILWDTYKFSDETEWEDLDKKHTRYFELLVALTKAWSKSMKDVPVSTNLVSEYDSKFGLPEPQNSGDLLQIHRASNNETTGHNREIPQKEHDRVDSDRVPSNRIRE